MTRKSIGEFEQLVLLAVVRLGDEAYGVPILEEIRGHSGRTVLRPAVYVALSRLEDKGLVVSHEADPSDSRGGRARKYFEITPEGLAQLRESRATLLSMWDGIQTVLDEG